jgi:ribosomal protein L12E/L44/L45/RPP1/RPP2
MSTFARRPSAIGSDEEIDKLMETRVDLNEYLKKNMKSMSDLIKAMKDEMFWDLIAKDFERYASESSAPSEKTEAPKEEKKPTETKKDEAPKEEKKVTESSDSDDLSEADLLAELENFN